MLPLAAMGAGSMMGGGGFTPSFTGGAATAESESGDAFQDAAINVDFGMMNVGGGAHSMGTTLIIGVIALLGVLVWKRK